MRLFHIRGGVHPDDRKHLAAGRPIEDLPLPALLHIPMQQHIGAPANPIVVRRQAVAKGEVIAIAQGAVSAPIHAPTSGHVVGLGLYPANHPSGLSVRTITLQPDGQERWHPDVAGVADPLALEPEAIAARVAAAGIVGLGGATFPAAVKLNLRTRYQLHTLVINGSECEPYLTCDDQLMRERPDGVIDGARIMARALGVGRVLIGIEGNKPQALAALRETAAGLDDSGAAVTVVRLPTRYPMGSEKHLVQTLTGLETPARGLTADIGVVVHNPATAFAVHEALREGRPLISRVVTVTGEAIREPRNLRVPIGTKVETLVAHCGGFTEEPARLVSGGPMMGQPLPELRVPIMKGTNGVLALTGAELHARPTTACIRCASCVGACPCGLVPLDMAAHTRAGDLDGAVSRGLLDCIGCGSCAYVCPAHIPLVQYFNHAKGELAARGRVKQKQTETRRLAEQRTARLETQLQAKREAMARQKAEAAARKAAAAAKTAESQAGVKPGAEAKAAVKAAPPKAVPEPVEVD